MGQAVMQLETRIANLEDKTEFLAVREQGLVGMLCTPRDDQRVPGILVFGGSGGGIPEYEVRLLGAHGFAAFGVRYFGADGLPSSLAHIPLEYFGRAAVPVVWAWLAIRAVASWHCCLARPMPTFAR
jgi:hypothetical protein